jgi:large subunit ribosomal protein L29
MNTMAGAKAEKKNTVIDLRKKEDKELADLVVASRQALFNLRLRKVTDVIEDPSEPRKLKKDVARALTLLAERKQAIRGAASIGATGTPAKAAADSGKADKKKD